MKTATLKKQNNTIQLIGYLAIFLIVLNFQSCTNFVLSHIVTKQITTSVDGQGK